MCVLWVENLDLCAALFSCGPHQCDSLFQVSMSLFKASHKTLMWLLPALGSALVALTLVMDPISDKCSPLLRVSVACISRWPSIPYQYVWLVISLLLMAAASLMALSLSNKSQVEHNKRVYAHCLTFARSHDCRSFVISSWRANVWSESVNTDVGDHKISTHRRCIYVAIFIPLGLLAAVSSLRLAASYL